MIMSSIKDYLSSHAFFSGLSDDFIEFLADSATKMRIKDGESLFKQGERADKFYLLRSADARHPDPRRGPDSRLVVVDIALPLEFPGARGRGFRSDRIRR
jgi:hypothetical protein